MTRMIKYRPKTTSANTTYVELFEEDHAWLKTELIRWLALMSEQQGSDSELWSVIQYQYWSKRTKTLPKGKLGLNSPQSFIGGLINNLVFGTQRDFTESQTEAVRDISAQLAQLFDSVEPIVFRISII